MILACASLLALLTLAPLPRAPQPPDTTKATVRVEKVTGTLVSVQLAKKLIKVRTAGGEEVAATPGARVELFKNAQRAQLEDFMTGARVTARIARRSDGQPGELLELLDEATSAARSRVRRALGEGVAQSVSPTAVDLKRDDGSVVTYRVTGATRFFKADRPAKPSDFKAGDRLAVKPRALPSGGVQASLVAESAVAVERRHRDTLSSWSGTLAAVEAESLTLTRDDGAMRRVALAEGAKITQGRSVVAREELRVGRRVRLHLVKGEPTDEGGRTADAVALLR